MFNYESACPREIQAQQCPNPTWDTTTNLAPPPGIQDSPGAAVSHIKIFHLKSTLWTRVLSVDGFLIKAVLLSAFCGVYKAK
jgi:hypothetical protein